MMTRMTHSTNSTPSDEESLVLVRRTEATGKWRPLICAEFEGAPSLYLTAEDWVDCGLKVGMRMSVKQYADLERRAKVVQALREALKLLEVRPRFEGELSRALLRKGWEREVIDGALVRLREKGLLNDEARAGSRGSLGWYAKPPRNPGEIEISGSADCARDPIPRVVCGR